MKSIILCLAIFIIAGCHPTFVSTVDSPVSGMVAPPIKLSQKQIDEQNEIIMRAHSFNWLVGKWTRTNDEPNFQTYEEWESISPIEYRGSTYTVSTDTLVWKEESGLKIEYDDNILRVKNVDKDKIKFFCNIDHENKFTCSNSSDEYPHYIIYEMIGDTLHSSIEGGGPTVLFKYIKSVD